jgi:hypothetical protein
MKKKIIAILFRFINLITKEVGFETEKTMVINQLNKQNLFSVNSIVNNNKSNKITISLTTFGIRINDVYLAIESIGKQTLKPSRVILWLSQDEYHPEKLPITLMNLKLRGLEIKFCKDLRSYKKIIPTIKECPNDLIITIDDDVIYNFDLIEVLYKNHLKDPKVIYCGQAKVMKIKKKLKFDYSSWVKVNENSDESLMNFPIGFGGVLYFPGCFDTEVLNEDAFMSLAPTADDIWLKAMSLINKIPVKQVSCDFSKFSKFIPLGIAQEDSLSIANVRMEKNNEQLTNVFKQYNCFFVFK